MRIVIDGIGFQPDAPPASAPPPLWFALIVALASRDEVDLVVLDRGGLPSSLPVAIPFPPRRHVDSAADSILLQQMCDHLGATVFISTGFTTPLSTPAVLLEIDDVAAADEAEDEDIVGERALARAYAHAACAPTAEGPGPLSPSVLADRLLECARTARASEEAAAYRWTALRMLQAAVDAR